MAWEGGVNLSADLGGRLAVTVGNCPRQLAPWTPWIHTDSSHRNPVGTYISVTRHCCAERLSLTFGSC